MGLFKAVFAKPGPVWADICRLICSLAPIKHVGVYLQTARYKHQCQLQATISL